MIICDTLKRLLKRSNEKNVKTFGDLISGDFLNKNRSYDEIKSQCSQITKNLIKNIPSLSEEQMQQKYEQARKDLQTLKEHTPKMLHGVKDFTEKYECVYHAIEEYRNELKKRIDEISK